MEQISAGALVGVIVNLVLLIKEKGIRDLFKNLDMTYTAIFAGIGGGVGALGTVDSDTVKTTLEAAKSGGAVYAGWVGLKLLLKTFEGAKNKLNEKK